MCTPSTTEGVRSISNGARRTVPQLLIGKQTFLLYLRISLDFPFLFSVGIIMEESHTGLIVLL